MELCSKCGANIEGLVNHCDCCGAPIVMHDDFISWHTFVMQASGDLSFFANKLFLRVVPPNIPLHLEKVRKIEFELYCYPQDIICSERLSTGVYYSKVKGKVRVRVIVDYDVYVSKTTQMRKIMVADAIMQGICLIKKRLAKSDRPILEYLSDIEGLIQQTDPVQF